MTRAIVYQYAADMPRLLLRDLEQVDYFDSCAGAPERALIEWARQFVQPNRIALDIGAHVGTWCLTLHASTHGAEWHAFEPQKRIFNALAGAIALNGLNDRIIPHRLALSDHWGFEGTSVISADGGSTSIAEIVKSRRREAAFPALTELEELVECEELDTFWRNIDDAKHVGFMKIDAEGSELAILEGAVETIRASRPTIIVESWTHEVWKPERARLVEHLVGIDYRVTPITGWPEMLLCEPRHREAAT